MNYHTGELAISSELNWYWHAIIFCYKQYASNKGLFTLQGGWVRQIGEVTCSGSPHLLYKHDQITMRDYTDRWVTPPKPVASPTWSPPPSSKQALSPVEWQSKATGLFIAAAVSEPEVSERGSSLIGKKLHYRGIQHFFLPSARNHGYARMKDLGYAMDSQGIVVMCELKI